MSGSTTHRRAELRLSPVFDSRTWRRHLCLRIQKDVPQTASSQSTFSTATASSSSASGKIPEDHFWSSLGGRCNNGRLLKSLEDVDDSDTILVGVSAGGSGEGGNSWRGSDESSCRNTSCNSPSFEFNADSSKVLAAWRRWDPGCEDPDAIISVTEYFPLGPTRKGSVSFLRARLKEADEFGDEIIVTRGTRATPCEVELPGDNNDNNNTNNSSTPLSRTTNTACDRATANGSAWQLWRPAPLPQRWLPPISEGILGQLLPSAFLELLPVQLSGIRVVDGTNSLPANSSLSSLREALSGEEEEVLSSTRSQFGGFLESAPWSRTTRVARVEEHCRDAQLGLWGWIFRLKHSVLAVHLETTTRDDRQGGGSPLHRDMLYIDKNADIGVSWRRAGFRESFNEAPRENYSVNTNLPLHTFWKAVMETKAFEETQERSNCQHFVNEVLRKVASVSGQPEEASGKPFELRNQGVADVLRSWGYLDEDCKPTEESMNGRQVLMGQAWRLFMSWDCKAGATRFFTPWMERMPVTPASTSSAPQ
mmetsp:Transcript_88280/g.193473  ORF Transcript_88280/g.193473 Transcript_88280/m.193473 type:complete len:536 (+) Transcript_88280:25-1632(+)